MLFRFHNAFLMGDKNISGISYHNWFGKLAHAFRFAFFRFSLLWDFSNLPFFTLTEI